MVRLPTARVLSWPSGASLLRITRCVKGVPEVSGPDDLRTKLAEMRVEAENLQRAGDYEDAARLLYGEIPLLEAEVEASATSTTSASLASDERVDDAVLDEDLLKQMQFSLYRALGKADLKVAAVPQIAEELLEDMRVRLDQELETRMRFAIGRRIEEAKEQVSADYAERDEAQRLALAQLEQQVADLQAKLQKRLPRITQVENQKSRIEAQRVEIKSLKEKAESAEAARLASTHAAEGFNEMIAELEDLRQTSSAFRSFWGGENDAADALEQVIAYYKPRSTRP